MDIDYKNIVGNIANYIVQYTFIELPKFNFILGIISEDEFRKQTSLCSSFKAHHIEKVIIDLRDMKRDPEKIKSAYSSTLRFSLIFSDMLRHFPDLLKVMDDMGVEGVSMRVKECLGYMSEPIAASKCFKYEENLINS